MSNKIPVLSNSLEDLALDWAVARAEGVELIKQSAKPDYLRRASDNAIYAPSKIHMGGWLIAGPILERLSINITHLSHGANAMIGIDYQSDGHSALVAVLRCYVQSELGDTVEVPKELL